METSINPNHYLSNKTAFKTTFSSLETRIANRLHNLMQTVLKLENHMLFNEIFTCVHLSSFAVCLTSQLLMFDLKSFWSLNSIKKQKISCLKNVHSAPLQSEKKF